MSSLLEGRYAISKQNRSGEFPDPACPKVEGRFLDFALAALATGYLVEPRRLLIESWNGGHSGTYLSVTKEGMLYLGEPNIVVLEGPLAGSICLNTAHAPHLSAPTTSFETERDITNSGAQGIAVRTLSRFSSALPRVDNVIEITKKIIKTSGHPAIQEYTHAGNRVDKDMVISIVNTCLKSVNVRDQYAPIEVLLQILIQSLNPHYRNFVDVEAILNNCKAYDTAIKQYSWMISQLSKR